MGGKNFQIWAKEKINYEKLKYVQDTQNKELEIIIYANLKSIKVESGKEQLWTAYFPAVRKPDLDRLGRYASVNALVIKRDFKDPRLMATRKFLTGQPTESHKLLTFIKSLQKGRLGILIGIPDFLKNFLDEHVKYFESIGSRFLPMAGHSDLYVMVWETGDNTYPSNRYKETLKLRKNVTKVEKYLYYLERLNHGGETSTSPVKIVSETLIHSTTNSSLRCTVAVSLFVPLLKNDLRCHWMSDPQMGLQADFCLNYEGYDQLCTCNHPYVPSQRPSPPSIDVKETIPIVIVTANKPYHLYRILRNLDLVWGAGETPVHIVIDGYDEETVKLSEVFGYNFTLHRPQGNPKENTRANMNIGFSLWAIFNTYQQARKAILLEDDLLLSPDLLSFFHQTSHLLDVDDTLSHINAFGQNSYPLTAANLSTLLRVEIYPQYGWMTTRKWFKWASTYWVTEGKGVDWDWWLFNEGPRQGLSSLVPEVSRTGHAGSAGAHVTGFRQFYYFHTRIMSSSFNVMPVIDAERISPPVKYDQWLAGEIRRAKKIHLTDHPCDYNIFPKNERGPFVLFLGVPARDDEYDAFYLMQSCLGTEETDLKEIHYGIMRLNVLPYEKSLRQESERRILYLVGCPMSSLCEIYSNKSTDWIYPSPDLLVNLPNRGFFRKYVDL